ILRRSRFQSSSSSSLVTSDRPTKSGTDDYGIFPGMSILRFPDNIPGQLTPAVAPPWVGDRKPVVVGDPSGCPKRHKNYVQYQNQIRRAKQNLDYPRGSIRLDIRTGNF